MTPDDMTDGAAAPEPTREELLDRTPEAVAMRRAREMRAEAKARAARAEAERTAQAKSPSSLRRKLILGGVLGLATAARVLSKIGRTARTP